MRRGLLVVVVVVAAALLATIGVLLLRTGGGYSFAVTGDLPYTPEQQAAFPRAMAQIDDDRDVAMVVHLGDVKDGSAACGDEYLTFVKGIFDDVEEPLVYTPGDNEWSDCHRPESGGYDPLERLDRLRRVFFAGPNDALAAQSDDVVSQAERGMPENVRWRRGGVSFAALHVVGGNNGMGTWTGKRGPTPQQTAEVLARTAGAVEEIHDVFAAARGSGDRAVVLFMQADLFAPGSAYDGSYAYQPIVQALAREARDFGGPVYLFNGDTHRYAQDRPLQGGSPWLEFYGVRDVVPNLTRVTIDGAENATGYLRVSVGRGDEVLTWRTVPFDT